jgi:hypothetical protein
MQIRRYAVLGLAIACAALLGAGSAGAARSPGKITRVDARCDGDLISGKARISAAAMLSLQLYSRRSARAKFVATHKLAWMRARKAGSYKFRFDISRSRANAYRIRAKSGAKSRILPAATCAPGHQVPEAPFAILLPLSLVLVLGLPLGLRRLRRRTALSRS